MESISFALEMRDSMSGPARAIKTSLSDLRAQIKGTSEATIALQRAQINAKASGNVAEVKRLNSEIAHQRLDLKSLNLELKAASQSERDFAKANQESAGGMKLAEAAAEGLEAAVAAVAVAAIAGAGLIAGLGAKMAIDSGTFKAHMSNAFAIMKGSAVEGQKTYESTKALARTLGVPREEIFESTQELLSLGIQGDNRLANTKGAFNEATAGRLKGIISGAQETTMGGRLRGTFAVTPQDLLAIHVSYNELAKTLGKQIGKSTAEATLMLRQGRVSAAAGIDALNKTISGGAIGEAAEAATLAPAALFERFKGSISDLFDDVEIKPFLAEVKRMIGYFSETTSSGRALKMMITTVFGEGAAFATKFARELGHAFLRLEIGILETVIKFGPLIKEIRKLKDSQTAIDAIGLAFRLMSTYIEFAVSQALRLVGTLAQAVSLIDELRGKKDAGAQIGAGLANGMASQLGPVAASAAALGTAAVSGIKKVLDIHSPSRVMHGLGEMTAQGFADGAEAGRLPAVGGPVRAADLLPDLGDAGIMGGGGGRVRASDLSPSGGGGGRSVSLGGITLNVTGVSDAASLPALLEPLFADLLDRIAEEVA